MRQKQFAFQAIGVNIITDRRHDLSPHPKFVPLKTAGGSLYQIVGGCPKEYSHIVRK
jgi:hypothetical protein